jgi:hypothetical protein
MLALGIIFLTIKKDYDSPLELPGVILVIFGALFVLVVSISLPVIRADYKANEQQYYAIQKSIDIARQSPELTQYERAALTTKIISVNECLASAKYYNTYFDLWIPDSFINLEPLK